MSDTTWDTQRCSVCMAETRRVFNCYGFWIRECNVCRHQFAEIELSDNHVSEIYSDAYFLGGGAGYSNYLSEADYLIRRGRYYATLVSKHMKPGRALDVGSAAGFIAHGLTHFGWNVEALEPNAAMASHAEAEFGLQVHRTTLEEFSTEGQFDLIIMVQVVGHFFDIRAAFKNAARLLIREGHVLIEAWDCRSLTARLLGRRWHEYSPPSVLQFFNRRSLEALAGQFGLRKVAAGRPEKKISAGHIRSLLRHKLKSSLLAWLMTGMLPDSYLLPYPAEDLFWILLRKP